MASVLEGVKVLDLSSGIAGPVAGMLLADHGADVVKVEPPGGDPLRGTAGYDAWIRGRRSAELDLKDAGERATFLALASDADVVLESFSPGTTRSTRHRRRHLARRQPAAGVPVPSPGTARTRRTATAPAGTPWWPSASVCSTSSAVISGVRYRT
jgi:crotonobetainyl-CoA:carnitine CoA-transferase CaiB-like acyl-CoA transferase